MSAYKITIVDDYEDSLELLDYNLYKAGYKSTTFSNSVEASAFIDPSNTDMVLTDWLMPDMNGLDLVKQLKRNPLTRDIPVLMITCVNSENEIAEALQCGVDDYMVKPFRMKELVARIEKIRTLYARVKPQEIVIDDLRIDLRGFTVFLEGRPLPLTYSEFKLLELFATRPNTVFSRSEIIQLVSGPNSISTERAVDVLIVNLRKKLAKNKSMIETVRSVGYRLAH